ncbi:ribonuclease III [Daedalea quercina L-15889]|uniref:Large ribosomal subunit protein mL44 n=1 Tax=Daedalea quercina L-15889 TaxID=1314783 RepID=A0A165MFQ7_9APHY|nr:ribonuclease III [Daedalea quercina L-15889]
MGYVQKRLASTAAKLAVSPSHVHEFLSKKAVASTSSRDFFDAQTWAALQSPPESALTTFAHRIGLADVLGSPDVVRQACTHPSFLPLYTRHYPEKPQPATNANLATLGNSLLGLFATEHINATYPHLPTRVMKAAVSAYVGGTTCAAVAKEMGAAPLLRWQRTPTSLTRPAVLHPDALGSVPRALTGLVYKNRSLLSARKFVQRFFLSREIDLRSMIKFRDPRQALMYTVQKFGREPPKSRLLKETGRFSNSPIFVVGIYSGADKLGEGFGSSLKMAEFRAAEDSLHRLYLTRQPPHLVQLPTSTFPAGRGSIFDLSGPEGSYKPGSMSDSEVLYGSAGRTGAQTPGRHTIEGDEGDLEDIL